MGSTLRVALVGAGQMAHQHLHALAQLTPPVVVAGVCDPVRSRAADLAARAGGTAFSSIRELMASAQPDVVHICTPPPTHFDAARVALDGGAHVYVEKPFALTSADARALVELARSRGRLVCAGHQVLRDRAFETLVTRAADLGTLVQVDSHFAFRPASLRAARASARLLADQLVDVLPHPLYLLVAALERFAPADPIELAWAHSTPTDLQATLRAGELVGRLSVSLRARPVASSLTLVGTRGSLTADFVRSTVIGAANPGTEAIEKILNPMVEGAQLLWRTSASLARRAGSGARYPGLAEMIHAFYRAAAEGGPSPVPPEHLLRVTGLFEGLAARVEAAADRQPTLGATAPRAGLVSPGRGPGLQSGRAGLAVVTGARGFLGSEIARALRRAESPASEGRASGWKVRGIARGSDPGQPETDDWVVSDLGEGLPPAALAGASVVIHAAAETAGGYGAHRRNTIKATRHLLHSMHAAGVSRLVLVSSLSVLAPPRAPWGRQDERTPRARCPRRFGAYTWGKCLQEALVEREAAALGIAVRMVRPGALMDWREPEVPALMGRRLFGRWHLGLGRPGLPIAVCDVARCAEVIAWCAVRFDDAPPVINLLDPAVMTRGDLVSRLRAQGWSGRMLWAPISVVAIGIMAMRGLVSLLRGRRPVWLAAWSILRPRRYDGRVAEAVLEAARQPAGVTAAAIVDSRV